MDGPARAAETTAASRAPGGTNPAPSFFDAHMHIIDPRFAMPGNRGYRPAPFTVTDYRARVACFAPCGGAVVAGSFQGFDQRPLLDALRELGTGWVGVAQVPPTITDRELHRLEAAGVRALRFNLRRGTAPDLGDLEALARRAHALHGWHAELYVDSRHLDELRPRLARLPRIVVDHLGLSAEGFDALLRLVDAGAGVKACGFGRVDFPVAPALRTLAAANPAALVFGTDLPGTRAPRAFEAADLELVRGALGEALAARVLRENAARLYRPRLAEP